jgi:hypothetical protein
MGKGKFIRLDGDNIGDKIELALMNEDFKAAQSIHNKVQTSLEIIRRKIMENNKMEILMYGSDDILFCVDEDYDYIGFLKQIMKEFSNETNFTISIGIGNSIFDSINNLRKAKLSGKNKIEEDKNYNK